jgi:hypothetical protein
METASFTCPLCSQPIQPSELFLRAHTTESAVDTRVHLKCIRPPPRENPPVPPTLTDEDVGL